MFTIAYVAISNIKDIHRLPLAYTVLYCTIVGVQYMYHQWFNSLPGDAMEVFIVNDSPVHLDFAHAASFFSDSQAYIMHYTSPSLYWFVYIYKCDSIQEKGQL